MGGYSKPRTSGMANFVQGVANVVAGEVMGNVQQQYVAPPDFNQMKTGKFSSNLMDGCNQCCGSCCQPTNYRSWCCPCLQVALNDAALNGYLPLNGTDPFPAACVVCCCGLPTGINCYSNIGGDPFDDCCKMLFCSPCVISQDAR